ncbi:hypothetical protein PanWU01x14_010700, partial [Parasponia andersonii]
ELTATLKRQQVLRLAAALQLGRVASTVVGQKGWLHGEVEALTSYITEERRRGRK